MMPISMIYKRQNENIDGNGAWQDSRSQSLPTDLDNGTQNITCDLQTNMDTHILLPKLEQLDLSSSHETWFKTWPERYEKKEKYIETSPDSTATDHEQTSEQSDKNIGLTNKNRNLTLQEALQNISLAYSPVTKQLHLVNQKSNDICNIKSKCNAEKSIEIELSNVEKDLNSFDFNGKLLGHRRNDPGSFSSTVSTLSEPSPSGSLLDSDDKTSLNGYEDTIKLRKKSFTSFFNKKVFSWKSPLASQSGSTSSAWKIFGRTCDSPNNSPQHVSSSALIPNMRPPNLPAKTEEEEMRHQQEYKAMLAAAKKKEAQNSIAKQKNQKLQLQLEEQQAQSAKHFSRYVLDNWETLHNTKKTRELWWLGLPSSVRGRVWRLAIGNELNLSQQLYAICQSRANNRLNNVDPLKFDSEIDQESSMDVIQLDISRTFPSLCIFQEGGPYSYVLHSLLAAYVCYRPDVGYVQGMSYIAAILILNMEEFHAFVCFANLLNRPLHISAFTLNQTQMQAYYNAYNEIFNYNLPKLYQHFECSGLTPDLYLLDWIYTIYAKAMPLDIACRIWDLFLRDGDEFIFRTALGILHLNQELLMEMDFLHGAKFLTRLPENLPVDKLFKSIRTINTSIGKQTFIQIVDKFSAT